MRIANLSTKSGSMSSSDKFVTDNGTTVTKIDYNALAKAIIEQYTGSSLAGSAQSVKAALDALNSKTEITATVYNERGTINYQCCYRVGDVVYVNIDFTTAQSFSQNTAFQGLPVPRKAQYLSVSANDANVQITNSASNGITLAGLLSGRRIWISGSYVL